MSQADAAKLLVFKALCSPSLLVALVSASARGLDIQLPQHDIPQSNACVTQCPSHIMPSIYYGNDMMQQHHTMLCYAMVRIHNRMHCRIMYSTIQCGMICYDDRMYCSVSQHIYIKPVRAHV